MTTAFLFPGQGSQQVGMLSAHVEQSPIVAQTFIEASDYVSFDLWGIVQKGPEEQLNDTAITQPALLAADMALWRVWRQQGGLAPAYMAGHSLGEYAALCAAGALSFKDALCLVAKRGQWMQQAVPVGQGAMAAILGLSDQQIDECCVEASTKGVVTPANYNTIGQTVIAGEVAAVELAMQLATDKGAKLVKQLAVSVPAHCALMASAAETLLAYMKTLDWQMPTIPVLQNYDVVAHDNIAAIQQSLCLQMTHPVRWVETMKKLQQFGVEVWVECGPGKVLSGLARRMKLPVSERRLETPDTLLQAMHQQQESVK